MKSVTLPCGCEITADRVVALCVKHANELLLHDVAIGLSKGWKDPDLEAIQRFQNAKRTHDKLSKL